MFMPEAAWRRTEIPRAHPEMRSKLSARSFTSDLPGSDSLGKDPSLLGDIAS